MEFKEVKIVGDTGVKSVQEVEKELLEKHEQQFREVNSEITPIEKDVVPQVEDTKELEEVSEKYNIKEEDILSFMKERYNRDINSIDELNEIRETSEELPEDVAAYYNYKKETGRGIEDFVKLNQTFDESNPDSILKEYLTATEKGLDEEDIESMMEDYSYDEDLDDEATIRRVRLSKKKLIAKAKDYFNSEKEKYKFPLESSGGFISEDDQKALDEYKQYISQSSTYEEEIKRKSDWFSKKQMKFSEVSSKVLSLLLMEIKKLFIPREMQMN